MVITVPDEHYHVLIPEIMKTTKHLRSSIQVIDDTKEADKNETFVPEGLMLLTPKSLIDPSNN